MTRAFRALPLALLLLAAARAASAVAIVEVVPSASALVVGDEFEVEVRGSLSDPVLGFGFDLSWNVDLLEILGAPEIGSAWIQVAALDGDGLAGLAPLPIVGNDVLLATLRFRALAPGEALFATGATFGDLAEGFALAPLGFESHVEWGGASVVVAPEPASLIVLALVAAIGVVTGRQRRALK